MSQIPNLTELQLGLKQGMCLCGRAAGGMVLPRAINTWYTAAPTAVWCCDTIVVQPKDFTDDPHELLSEDLTGGVSFGHMIQVVKEVTFTGKAPPAPKKAAPKKKKNSEDVARTDSDMKYGDAEAATAGEKQSLL